MQRSQLKQKTASKLKRSPTQLGGPEKKKTGPHSIVKQSPLTRFQKEL